MRTPLKSEIKIGLIVIVAFAIFIWGLNYLKGTNLLHSSNYYEVYYDQINGLVKSSPVMLDGFQIGLVRDIEYQFDKPGHILVSLDLNKKLKVPQGTTAVIKSALMGNPNIDLILGQQNGEYLKSGDTLVASVEPSLIDKLSDGLLNDVGTLVKRTDSLIASVQLIIKDGDLKSTLKSLKKTSQELEQVSGKLNYTMSNEIPTILKNVNSMTAEFSGVGKQINQIDFKGTLSRFDKVLDEMGTFTVKLNSPENSIGLLLNDRSLYVNLSNTAESANKLLLDLKEKPKRYVHFSIFGSKEK